MVMGVSTGNIMVVRHIHHHAHVQEGAAAVRGVKRSYERMNQSRPGASILGWDGDKAAEETLHTPVSCSDNDGENGDEDTEEKQEYAACTWCHMHSDGSMCHECHLWLCCECAAQGMFCSCGDAEWPIATPLRTTVQVL